MSYRRAAVATTVMTFCAVLAGAQSYETGDAMYRRNTTKQPAVADWPKPGPYSHRYTITETFDEFSGDRRLSLDIDPPAVPKVSDLCLGFVVFFGDSSQHGIFSVSGVVDVSADGLAYLDPEPEWRFGTESTSPLRDASSSLLSCKITTLEGGGFMYLNHYAVDLPQLLSLARDRRPASIVVGECTITLTTEHRRAILDLLSRIHPGRSK